MVLRREGGREKGRTTSRGKRGEGGGLSRTFFSYPHFGGQGRKGKKKIKRRGEREKGRVRAHLPNFLFTLPFRGRAAKGGEEKTASEGERGKGKRPPQDLTLLLLYHLFTRRFTYEKEKKRGKKKAWGRPKEGKGFIKGGKGSTASCAPFPTR